MRKVFFLLLTCFSLFAKAQTAGNDNFQFTFVTYAQGQIVISVQSLVNDSCTLKTMWHWAGHDTTLFFAGHELRQIMLPSTRNGIEVQAKTVAACNVRGNGPWVSLSIETLPIRDIPRQRIPQPVTKPVHFRVYGIDGRFQFEMNGTKPQLITRLNQWQRGVFVVFDGMNSQMIANF